MARRQLPARLVEQSRQLLDRGQGDAAGVEGADRRAVAEAEQAMEILSHRTEPTVREQGWRDRAA